MSDKCECPSRDALERLRGAGDRMVVAGSVMLPAPFFASVLSALSTPCPCDQLRADRWECFHCGFKTSDPAAAQAHFGDRDDAEEFTPTCTWWSKLSADVRAEEFQDLRQQLNSEQEESGRLNIANEGLEHRLLEFEHVIDTRFKCARSINDIFHLYDTMEGLRLVAEAERDQLRAENAALRAADRKSRESGCWCDEQGHPCAGCGFRQQREDLRAETVELRESIDGWLEQCRSLEPLLPNWRGGDRIIDAAAKEIEQLRAENAALRAWLGRDAIYAEIQQQAVESVERILRGEAEAK